MKVSTLIELLLIFLIIAFAAGRVIDVSQVDLSQPHLVEAEVSPLTASSIKELSHYVDEDPTAAVSSRSGRSLVRQQRQGPPNRYCACTSLMCNCCRDFSLPVVPIKGPGCASVRYLQGDQMAVTMSFGDRVLRNVTISGKKPKPVCMGLPGGISKFCGRVYGISKEKDQFKACLGLELRALDDVEAALRVSCFKFGPAGLNLEPGQPVPQSNENKDDEDDDDDDDDDDLLGGGDDDDDDDDDDEEEEADDSENDVESGDYTGFSALGDGFLDTIFGGGDTDDEPVKKKKKKTSTSVEQDAVVSAASITPVVEPVVSSTVAAVPARKNNVTPATSNIVASKLSPETHNESPVTQRDESSFPSSLTPAGIIDRMDEPVTSTSMSVSVVQKMESAPAAAVVLEEADDEEAEGTDKVMEMVTTKSEDTVQSKEDDDEDDEEEDDDDDDDDLVDTAIKLVDDDDEDDDDKKKDDIKNKKKVTGDNDQKKKKGDKEKQDDEENDDDDDDDEDEDDDDEKSEESNKVDSNNKLEEVGLSASSSSSPSSTTVTSIKKTKEDKKKVENETNDKDDDDESSPAAILSAITTPLKSVTNTVTSTVAQTVASSLEDKHEDNEDDDDEDEARKIEQDRQMRMAKILEVQERFKHKVYSTSGPSIVVRSSRQHKRMQLPTHVEMARRR